MTDRVRIIEPACPDIDGMLATIIERERDCLRVRLDRRPLHWTSNTCWIHVRQCETVRRTAR